MARLKEYSGRFCESDYENAFIDYLVNEGWTYVFGNDLPRENKRSVIYRDDLAAYLSDIHEELNEEEINQIVDAIALVGDVSDFATLHKAYKWLVDGYTFRPAEGLSKDIKLIDFDNYENNKFKVVNQLTVEYTNNGKNENRRPDVLLYINGIPLCVIELKNPADANATIVDAWKQINIR